MERAKYPMIVTACVALLAACSDRDGLSAPRPGVRTTLIPPATLGMAVSATRTIALDAEPTLCLQAAGGANANGTAVTTAACSGAAAQQFTFDTSGAVRIFGDKCLDADMGRGRDGDRVQIWTCNGYAQQRWTLTAAGTVVGIGGKCVDLDYGQQISGARIQIWSCFANSANQTWTTRGINVGQTPTPTPVAPPVVSSGGVGSAELPRVYLNTAMPAVTGRTISVAAGGSLQGALDAAQPGDQVVLAAGASYVGNYVLPAKANAAGQWITVRTSGAIPAEGTRVGPGDAAQMPKILTPNAGPALATAPGTQGWRFTGLEIAATPAVTMNYTLVSFGTIGADQRTLAQVPGRIVIDRSYVHGSPTLDVRRCVALNSASTAVVDSYVSECHSRNGDSQAVMGWNGPGPFKIVNNRLEGGHENLGFGGSDPTVPGLVPADIEIRRNHVIKPASWRGVWLAKNLMEFKAGQRVLVEGNVFENNWVDAQNGFALLWQSTNQDGGCTWCITSDLTFRYNVVRNVAGGFNLNTLGSGSTGATNPAVPFQRVTIAHNVITGLDGSNGRLYQVLGNIEGLTIVNNSGVGIAHDLLFGNVNEVMPSLVFRNNVTGAQYTFFAAGAMGNAALTRMGIPAANVTGNVFAAGSGPGTVPTGNTYVASVSALGLPSLPSSGDPAMALTATSTSESAAGADVAKLAAATRGVVR